LAAAAGSQLVIIDRAGHNSQDEQTAEVIEVLRKFLAAKPPRLEVYWPAVAARARPTICQTGPW
jgi:hypothetical protein